ncbi:oxygenase MpaB family protein [Streptomyces sp. M10(2022)]
MNEADRGLFGPASVTWQMHADPMMWIAGVRALYLQALHPRAVRGVMQNSDFRKDAWGRLMRTADFVGALTYGTTQDAEKAGARVRKIHRTLKATDPVTGETYGIDEPELLLWVHCAEVDSYLQVQRRSGFPSPRRRQTVTSTNSARAHAWSASTRRRSLHRRPARRLLRAGAPQLASGPEAADVDDFLRNPRSTSCSSRHAHCCGAVWRHSPTTHCRVTPMSSTADPHPPRRRSTAACVRPEPPCAAFPGGCAGGSRPAASRRRWHGWVPAAGPPRTNSADRPPYWTGRGGRSSSTSRRSNGGDSRRWRTPG